MLRVFADDFARIRSHEAARKHQLSRSTNVDFEDRRAAWIIAGFAPVAHGVRF
jgi:hypothetical protein